MRILTAVTIVALSGQAVANSRLVAAQTSSEVFTEAAKVQFAQISSLVLRAAEKIDEDLYAYKPTPEVRSIAGLIGHIADGNVLLCTAASGEKPEITRIHEKKTTKSDVVAALKQSKDFCDTTIANMTDASGQLASPAFAASQKTPRLAWIHANNSHMWEHYGNLVTYMRLKNIVPPSSETR